MSRLLIDTNIYSGALRGNAEIVAVLRQVSHIGISSISIGELLSGFRAGNREKENRFRPTTSGSPRALSNMASNSTPWTITSPIHKDCG
jgi:hypothetical protein